ncbi:rhomboid family protein [Nibricoccus sp. IMCC34717]|uniref:rhomboid family protein n=1 Tax=Nibricoccus sp. IMCC34717 TaxID=3034021 RepID=UPI00385114D9
MQEPPPVVPAAPALSVRRCTRHPVREAVAKCRGCGQFYCRECITDHAGRVLCATCLAREAKAPGPVRRRWLTRLGRPLSLVAGFCLAWFLWYEFGRILVSIPHDVHDGTVWKRLAPP